MTHFPMIELSTQELDKIKRAYLWVGLTLGFIIGVLSCLLAGLWVT